MMLAVAGASTPTFANFFIKQLGDVLEYLLYFPAIIARLAFAAGGIYTRALTHTQTNNYMHTRARISTHKHIQRQQEQEQVQ